MKRLTAAIVAAVVVSLLAPVAAHAQDEEQQIIFGIYYRCNQAQETRADDIYRDVVAPVVQRHVEMGHLTGTLWLQHSQGGAWRRIWATMGTDLNQMMDMRQAIVDELRENHPEAMADLQAACPSHDDYIWIANENSANTDPDAVGGATLSAYHSCDMSREPEADAIFSRVLAPLYEKHTDMGHLASWGYYSHRVGGVFRRLETMSGADHKTLLAMQAAIYDEANEVDAAAMTEFRSICSWHSDYLWLNPEGQ
jgi:hypothetical protein